MHDVALLLVAFAAFVFVLCGVEYAVNGGQDS